MYFGYILLLSIFLIGCSHTTKFEGIPEDRPIELDAPIVQKFTPTSNHTLKALQRSSCNNKHCEKDELTKAMQQLGYVKLTIPTLVDILNEVENDRSVIVLLGESFYEVYGYELRDEVLFLFNQKLKSQRMSFSEFMYKWDEGKFWAQSFIRPHQIRPTMEQEDIYSQAKEIEVKAPYKALLIYKRLAKTHPITGFLIHDIMKLEKNKNTKRQITQYEKAIKEAPNDEQLWLGLVEVLKRDKRWSEAKILSRKVALMFSHKSDNLY